MKIRKFNQLNESFEDEIKKISGSLTEEQKHLLYLALDKLIKKYENMDGEYFDGVVDGINHCYKLISGVYDDYADGI